MTAVGRYVESIREEGAAKNYLKCSTEVIDNALGPSKDINVFQELVRLSSIML